MLHSNKFEISRQKRGEIIYIYKYLNDNNKVLYVGQAKNWKTRLYQHNSEDKNMMREVSQIFIMNCQDKLEMDILEKYYIQVYKPKFNKKDIGYNIPSIIPVHKKWEMVVGKGNTEYIYPFLDEQVEELCHSKFLTKELIIKVIEAIKEGKSLTYVYVMLMSENCRYNEAMDEIESIFCY